jgi:hypothetical protein
MLFVYIFLKSADLIAARLLHDITFLLHPELLAFPSVSLGCKCAKARDAPGVGTTQLSERLAHDTLERLDTSAKSLEYQLQCVYIQLRQYSV